MLHILWLIIKLILIILGIVLAVLLAAAAVLLFCPLRYQGQMKKEPELLWAQGKLSWLFGAVCLTASYQGEPGAEYSVKIFGVKLSTYRRWAKKLRRKKKKRPAAGKTESAGKELSDFEREERIESAPATQTTHEKEKQEKRKTRSRIFSWFGRILRIPGGMVRAFRDLRCTFKKICDKIRQTKKFFENEKVRAVVRLIFQQSKKVLRHVRPRTARGELCFGTGDPASTGQILGVLGVAYPLYGNTLAVTPDFEKRRLEGQLFIKGRIFGYFLLWMGLELYRNPDVKIMIQKIRKAK